MDKPEWLVKAEDEQRELVQRIAAQKNELAAGVHRGMHSHVAGVMHAQLQGMEIYNLNLSLRIKMHGGTTCAE